MSLFKVAILAIFLSGCAVSVQKDKQNTVNIDRHLPKIEQPVSP